eukprot:6064790-Prymnesium_polylepis.1
MFGTCPECRHYNNQCLKCSAVVDIGNACVCPTPVRVRPHTAAGDAPPPRRAGRAGAAHAQH